MNLLSFITKVLVGLWITPYLVNHIGVAAYGLVPLAMIFSGYVGLIVQSLNAAINRFLLIALQQNDFPEANRILNTSLIMILLLILLQSIIMTAILLNLSDIINIPEGLLIDSLYLFGFVFLGFFVSLVRGITSAPLFAHNRLDILRSIEIVQVLSRTAGIVIFFTLESPELKYVGIADFIASMIAFFHSLYYSRQLAPQLKIDISMIDTSKMRELSTMGGWVMVNQIGTLLFLKIDIFVANKFLGATQAGEYAIVAQWNTLFRVFAMMISGVLSPIIMILYAREELPRMIQMLKVGIKAMAVIMAIPLGIVSAMAGDLLAVWMGEHFRYLEYLLMFSLLPLVISLASNPLSPVNMAFNKVKIPGIVTLLLGTMNLALAILFTTKTELGLYGIILALAITLMMNRTIFIPMYSASYLGLPKFTFIKYYLPGIGFYIVSFVVAKYFSNTFTVDSILSLFLVSSGPLVILLVLLGIYIKFDPGMHMIVTELIKKRDKSEATQK